MITWIDTEYDSGAENLVDLMDEHCELQSEIVTLCNSFVEDVGERIKTLDMQYLTGINSRCTIDNIEPPSSATPKLSSLLHTYFSNTQKSFSVVAGTRKIHVQPTAMALQREVT